MDLGEILRVMRRRWYLMVPIMVVTFVSTALAHFLLPTSYESTSTVSLLSAERASIVNKNGNTNPYLTFDASLVATADFLSRSMTSKGAVEELKALDVTEEYTVALADNAQGPFITIVVTGDDGPKVLRSTTTLTEFAGQKLTEIQAASGVKQPDMIRLTTIIPPQKPEALIKDKLQIVIAIFGAGTAAAFVITFVTEGLARSRRAAGPEVESVRSVVSPEPTSDPERTAVTRLPPTQRSPATPPVPSASSPPSAEETQLLYAPAERVKAKPPAVRQGIGPLSTATVYRSNVTNGKPQEDGD